MAKQTLKGLLKKADSKSKKSKVPKNLASKITTNIEKPDKLLQQLELSKDQARYWQKKHDELQKTSSFDEKVISMFREQIKPLNAADYQIKEIRKRSKAESALFLFLADWHGGEIVTKSETMDMNEYNLDIMKERAEVVLQSVLSHTIKMKGYHFDELNIGILGDMVSGIIHEELLQGVAMVIQCRVVAETIAEMVINLRKHFKVINLSGVIGNHGRYGKQVKFKKKYDNFDYFVYTMIELILKDIPGIKFNFPKSAMLIHQVYGWNFLLRHGDMKIQSYAGIPFYGITRAETRIAQALSINKDVYPHYTVMGHLHQSASLEKAGGETHLVSSLKGVDEFSWNALGASSRPMQKMFVVHEKRGITHEMKLYCTDSIKK